MEDSGAGVNGNDSPESGGAVGEIGSGNGGSFDPIGNGQQSGDAKDPTSFIRTGKRGRHPGDCTCEKCVTKRAGGGIAGKTSAGNSSSKGQASGKALDVELFAIQLQGVHELLCIVTKSQVWKLSLDEAKKMASAIADVLKHHSITINPAYLAYGKLIMIGGAIYGPRLLLFKVQMEQQKKQQQNKETVFNTDGSIVQ